MNFNEIKASALWDLSHTAARRLIEGFEYPWEALDGLKDFITMLGKSLDGEKYRSAGDGIWIAKTAAVAGNVSISGPCIIGENTEVRPGVFIRGSALVGDGCVVGNSTELKNCILFDGVQVPHFNYVGDSIIGYKAHLGAGAVTSNVKSDKTNVTVSFGKDKISTGRRKLGALVGDFVEVGCNSVLNPGTVIGKNTSIYPLSSVRGYVPPNCILKGAETVPKR